MQLSREEKEWLLNVFVPQAGDRYGKHVGRKVVWVVTILSCYESAKGFSCYEFKGCEGSGAGFVSEFERHAKFGLYTLLPV